MHRAFTESIVEDAALAWLESLGYVVHHGPNIPSGMLGAKRSDPTYRDVWCGKAGFRHARRPA